MILLLCPPLQAWAQQESEPYRADAPTSAAASAGAAADTTPPTPPRADSGVGVIQAANYRIALQDVLHIAVWKEPDFSTTLQVRSDGKISLPLLNDVQAAGLTPMELAASIRDKLKKYVDDPRVTVVVSRMVEPHVYMVGEVMHHGPLGLTPKMTVLQALVTAGLTPFANTRKIYILRLTNGSEQKLPVNYKRLIKGRAMDKNFELQPEDMVVVP